MKTKTVTPLLFASALSLTACAGLDDSDPTAAPRSHAIDVLQQQTGGPVSVEINEAGTTRIVNLTKQFPFQARLADPATAAASFVAQHHEVFQLSAAEATSFVTTGVDAEPALNVTHVTLQRHYAGIPVFEGGLQILMDSGNNVIRATADELFRVGAPTNHITLSPAEAAVAAARSYGLALALANQTTEGAATVFESANLLEPVK